MKALVYAHKVNTRELLQRILSTARSINDAAVIHKVTSSLVTWVRKCIQADGGHWTTCLSVEWQIRNYYCNKSLISSKNSSNYLFFPYVIACNCNQNLLRKCLFLEWGVQVSCSTQRQAQELILGPSLRALTRLLFFNRKQSRVVIGLLTGHNTLRRRPNLMGPTNIPVCSWCGVEDETLPHIHCECEALASLRYVHLGSFFLDPEDIKSLTLGAIWNFSKGTGLPWTVIILWGTKGLLN
jgi:hypothetical protein